MKNRRNRCADPPIFFEKRRPQYIPIAEFPLFQDSGRVFCVRTRWQLWDHSITEPLVASTPRPVKATFYEALSAALTALFARC